MTRKHFKALADALKNSHPAQSPGYVHGSPESARDCRVWAGTVENVAYACRSFNPNFDRARFLTACGWEG